MNGNEKDINTTQQKKLISLTKLDVGRMAIVISLPENPQASGKLEAIGIVPGTEIMKKSASLMKGPIVIEKGAMQIAIGYQTAKRIIVEPMTNRIG